MLIPIIDGHQDLLWHIERVQNETLRQTSLTQLRASSIKLVFASLFTENDQLRADPTFIDSLLVRYHDHILHAPQMRLVFARQHVEQLMHSYEIGILLHIEGLDALCTKNWRVDLARWRILGVSSAGIVWNHSNCLGGGVGDPTTRLSARGREVVQWLDNHGMIVDLAHTNEATFYDILDVVQHPPVITHGNAKALANRQRNYTLQQLRELASRGGVIGVSFVPGFVTSQRPVVIEHLVGQFMYIIDKVGTDHVAIGSDLGGILSDQLIPGASRTTEVDLLLYALERRGLHEHEIAKIAYQNWQRIIHERLNTNP